MTDEYQLTYQFFPVKSNQPTVLFLHGLGGNLTVWNPYISAFNQAGYSCLLVDLRGHGLSPRSFPENVSLALYAQDVANLCNSLNITHPICIGHCFGGNVAIKLAGFMPMSVLVLTSVGLNIKVTTPVRSSLFKISTWMLSNPFSWLPASTPVHRFMKPKYYPDFDIMRIAQDIWFTSPSSYLRALTAIQENINPDYQQLSLPISVFHGYSDRIIPLNSVLSYHQQRSQTRIHLLNDNHLIPLHYHRNGFIPKLLTEIAAW